MPIRFSPRPTAPPQPGPPRMRALAGLLLAGLAAGAPAALRSETLPASSPRVWVEGRSVTTPRQGVKLGFPGVTLHLAVRGPSLSFQAEASADEVDFDVVVDGTLRGRVRLPRGEATTVLFQGLPDARHQVELVHATESSNGTCEVETLTAAAFLAPAPAPARRLLFIGDSFTCGAAAECRPGLPTPATKSRRQNARLSYGWMLSRMLSAQVSLVAYAGRGLLRDWQGLRTPIEAPEIYERALADDPAAPWRHADYVPDAIGVCLGNDFDAGIPDQEDYVPAYVEFVRKLRRDAPRAQIILIVSPVVSDPPGAVPRRTVLRAYMDQVVERLHDPRVAVADAGAYRGVPGDGHPDGAAHEAVAGILEPLFRKALQ